MKSKVTIWPLLLVLLIAIGSYVYIHQKRDEKQKEQKRKVAAQTQVSPERALAIIDSMQKVDKE
ncbi:MAG: hypothetical protein EOO10_15495 [Chitinophagaceae bacterium]|nr:MAG: hypothetical protein EOO10_15495 [Chitinophagaceae bacterium]